MKKWIFLILTVILFASVVEGQSVYGVKKLKKLGQIGRPGDTDSLLVYKPVRFVSSVRVDGVFVVNSSVTITGNITAKGAEGADVCVGLGARGALGPVSDGWSV